MDRSEYDNNLTSGYGLHLISDDEGYLIMDLESNHSIVNSGLMKGDYINSIDFESDTMIISSNMRDLNNYRVEVETYNPDIIEMSTIISYGDLNIGYLAFNRFNSESEEELMEIFTNFQDSKIDELILDLRLNIGGNITIVNLLLDLLIGQYHKNKLAFTMKFNKKYRAYNLDYRIGDKGFRLNLDRIYFLTSRNTLSASELLIKSLEPYIETILVGNMTGGKFFGMLPFYYEDTVYLPLSFVVENAEGFSNWNEGLRVDYYINDKFQYPYGDIDDPVIKKVLKLIK